MNNQELVVLAKNIIEAMEAESVEVGQYLDQATLLSATEIGELIKTIAIELGNYPNHDCTQDNLLELGVSLIAKGNVDNPNKGPTIPSALADNHPMVETFLTEELDLSNLKTCLVEEEIDTIAKFKGIADQVVRVAKQRDIQNPRLYEIVVSCGTAWCVADELEKIILDNWVETTHNPEKDLAPVYQKDLIKPF